MSSRKHFIVLGAGASYDFIEDKNIATHQRINWIKYKPPLASELFDTSRFGEIIGRYSEVSQLSSSVLSAVRSGKDIEYYMQELRDKGGHRIPQLIELIFYLGELFQTISDTFNNSPGNNYSGLIGEIRDNGGKACIVTFNYDSLLESNLGNQLIPGKHKLLDYIQNDIQIIKMHGSCEWSYVSGKYDKYDQDDIEFAGGLAKYLGEKPYSVYGIENDSQNKKTKPEIIPQRNFKKDMKNIYDDDIIIESYPALAIPVRTKHSHVCPDSHIEELKESLRSAEKILIIGWKASDENLLEIFEEVITHPIEFTIVAGKGSDTAEIIKGNIREKVKTARFKIVDQGFTGFMGSEACDDFFK